MSIRTWWSRTSADLPNAFWYLMAGAFVNRVGYVVEPFLALYLSGPEDLEPTTIGVVLTCFGAGAFASQVLGGYLADRIGRRATLLIGMLGTAACFMMLASVRQVVLIALTAALTGLLVDVYRPAVSAAVADLVPAHARPRAFALMYWAINLGVALAGVLGGILAERSYWLLFAADAFTCLAFALIIARAVPETRPGVSSAKPGSYADVLRDNIALGLFTSTLLATVVYAQQFVTLPLAVREAGLSASAYGLIYAVNPVTVILAQPLVMRVIGRLSVVPTMAVSSLLIGAGFALTGFAASIAAFAVTVVIWTIGEIGVNTLGPLLVAEVAAPHLRGRYNGLVGTAHGGAALLAPLAGTWLFGMGQYALWLACLLTGVLSGALLLAMSPAVARRRAALTPVPTP